MGIEKDGINRFDGKPVVAYSHIDRIDVNFSSDQIEIQGRTFVSAQAFSDGLEAIARFSKVINGIVPLLAIAPSNVEADAYAWLKLQPEFSGARDRTPPLKAASDVKAEKA